MLVAIIVYISMAWTAAAGSPVLGDGFEGLREGFADKGVAGARCTFEFSPSGSSWIEGVDERKVFLAAMAAGDWRLGIGKGGQIYSLRGPFGESVPPQRADAPWVDEVWHLVVTNENLVSPVHEFQNSDPKNNWVVGMPIQYFIHQAGIYLKSLTGTEETGSAQEPFYSPLLASKWDPESGTLYLVNWAQQARSPNVWKSGVLVQTAYRDIGRGAIEVVQILSNFGDEPITYMNAPWGGVRHSSLPNTILSQAEGGWKRVEGTWGWGGIPSAPFNETGGWIGWTRDQTDEASPSLGLVFGLEDGERPPWQRARSKILYGSAAKGSPRDYDAVETSCSVNLPPGESLMVRWYLVVDEFAAMRGRAAELSGKAKMWKPEFDGSVLKPVWLANGVPAQKGEGSPSVLLHALPVKGTVPVYLFEETATGNRFAAIDPYTGVRSAPYPNPLPKDHPVHATYDNREVNYQYESGFVPKALLGFASPTEKTGTVRVELPGAGGKPLVVWAPGTTGSTGDK